MTVHIWQLFVVFAWGWRAYFATKSSLESDDPHLEFFDYILLAIMAIIGATFGGVLIVLVEQVKLNVIW